MSRSSTSAYLIMCEFNIYPKCFVTFPFPLFVLSTSLRDCTQQECTVTPIILCTCAIAAAATAARAAASGSAGSHT